MQLYKPGVLLSSHTPIDPALPDKQKAVPRRGGAEAQVPLGGEFRDTAELTGKKKNRQPNRSMQTSSNKLLCSWPAGRGWGGKGVRVSRHAVLAPGAPSTVASCLWQDGMDEEDVGFGKADVPEGKYLVNTDRS